MAIGDVLGGVAQARVERLDRGLRERSVAVSEGGLKLGQQQFGFQQDQATAASKTAQIKQLMELAAPVIEDVVAARGDGIELVAIEESLAPILQALELLGATNEITAIQSGLQRAGQAADPGQLGAAEGLTESAKLDALLGRPATETERVEAAGVTPPTVPDPDIVKLNNAAAVEEDKLSQANQIGDTAAATRAQNNLDNINGVIKQRQLQGVEAQLLTTKTRSDAEATIRVASSGLEFATALKTVLDNIGEGNLGLKGATKGLINKTVAQFIPGLFSKDRAVVESSIKSTREALNRVTADQTRFSDADRTFVAGLFPSEGVLGTEEEADIKIRAVMNLFARRIVGAAKIPGVDLPIELTNFTVDDIREAVRLGTLSKKEAKEMVDSLFASEFEEFRGVQ